VIFRAVQRSLSLTIARINYLVICRSLTRFTSGAAKSKTTRLVPETCVLLKRAGLSAVTNSPDDAVPILAKEKCAIFCNGDSHWATPDLAFGCNETCHEIFVFTARFAGGMIERHTHNFVTGALHPVP